MLVNSILPQLYSTILILKSLLKIIKRCGIEYEKVKELYEDSFAMQQIVEPAEGYLPRI